VADPVGTAEAAYAYFGLPFTGAAGDAMRALSADRGATGVRPAHQYTLRDFGLSEAEVGARFSGLTAELR
jgi:hypothetical protein